MLKLRQGLGRSRPHIMIVAPPEPFLKSDSLIGGHLVSSHDPIHAQAPMATASRNRRRR